MIFDQYDRVRIINLPERVDRRAEMDAELAALTIRDRSRIAYFPAIRPSEAGMFESIGAHGCFRSHLTILQQALDAGESVLVLEDDCTFLPAVNAFEQASDTAIFYGGWGRVSNPEDLQNSDLHGAHFMGFTHSTLQTLVPFLQSILDPGTRFDPAVVRSDFDPRVRPPIDGAYIWFRRYNPHIRTEFMMLADQRASASDIAERKWFDRMPVIRSLANKARRVREGLR